MCNQNGALAANYGEVVPGWCLLRATRDYLGTRRGDWALATDGIPECWWPSELEPLKNPAHGQSDDAIDLMGAPDIEAIDRFVQVADDIWGHVRMEARTERCLMVAAEEEGFDRERFFLSDWLVHRMAVLIAKSGVSLSRFELTGA